MNFKVGAKVFDRFPDAKFGALLIEGINNKDSKEVDLLLKETIDEVASYYTKKEIYNLGEIKGWRRVFDEIGLDKKFSPSHEALLKRVVSKKELPSINSLVNIYNIISLKNLIPVGGHDVSRIENIKIDVTKGGEKFVKMNSEEVEDVGSGEIAYMTEDDDILTRHFVWRQGDTSKIDKDTTSVFIPIDNVLGNFSDYRIKRIASEIISYIQKYLDGTAKFGIVDLDNPELDFDELSEFEPIQNIVPNKKPKIITDETIIDEIVTRGISNILPSREEFKKLLMSGKRLTIYQGYDPSASSLHVGNAIGMGVLERFRRLGHKIIFLIGTGTGKIGDPTDKNATRTVLSDTQIRKNIASWKDQAAQVIDFDNEDNPVEIVRNGDWLKPMTLDQFLTIGNHVTIQQLLERDMFQRRIEEGKPISVSEVLYPLLQGYDSVVLQVDAEFGGNDQLFNMMMGRNLEKTILGKEKFVITGKLITDASGTKMGKSLGNVINLTDEPKDIYGKVMSFTDGMIHPGFEILTEIPMEEVDKKQEKIDKGKVNPIDIKKELAFEVTKWIKGENAAQEAQEYFEEVHQKQNKEHAKTYFTSTKKFKTKDFVKYALKKERDEDISNSHYKRLISQGGVTVTGITTNNKEDNFKVKDYHHTIDMNNHKSITLTTGSTVVNLDYIDNPDEKDIDEDLRLNLTEVT